MGTRSPRAGGRGSLPLGRPVLCPAPACTAQLVTTDPREAHLSFSNGSCFTLTTTSQSESSFPRSGSKLSIYCAGKIGLLSLNGLCYF